MRELVEGGVRRTDGWRRMWEGRVAEKKDEEGVTKTIHLSRLLSAGAELSGSFDGGSLSIVDDSLSATPRPPLSAYAAVGQWTAPFSSLQIHSKCNLLLNITK